MVPDAYLHLAVLILEFGLPTAGMVQAEEPDAMGATVEAFGAVAITSSGAPMAAFAPPHLPHEDFAGDAAALPRSAFGADGTSSFGDDRPGPSALLSPAI